MNVAVCNARIDASNAFSSFPHAIRSQRRRIYPAYADLGCAKMLTATSGRLSLCVNAQSREPDHQVVFETLRRMPLKALKEELSRLGMTYTDCYEKEELVRKLASAYDMSNKKMHAAKSDIPIFQLPMKRLKGTLASPKEYILIPLIIGNQGPFNFLLDTGSSITIISPKIAYDKLQILQNSGKISYGIGGTGSHLYGTKTVSLPPIKIMEHSCGPAEALVMDISGTGLDSEVAGLVGMNILSQFDVEFDFVSQKLLFYAAAASEKHQGIVRGLQQLVTTTANFGIPSVQVKIGKGMMQAAIIDFGSSQNVCSIDAALGSGLSYEALGKGVILGGYGVGGTQVTFYSADMDLKILTKNDRLPPQPLKFSDVRFAVGDLPAMRAVGANIILGLTLFTHSKVIISMSSSSVYMQATAAMTR